MTSLKEQPLSDGYQFAHTILNSISAHVAILDRDGFILETNNAWRNFAHQNDLRVRPEQLRVNYLDICEKSSEDTAGESSEVAQGNSSCYCR